MPRALATIRAALLVTVACAGPATAGPAEWRGEWQETDFSRHSVPFGEIRSGGVRRDSIPSIDAPRFVPVAEDDTHAASEPVIGLEIGGVARAYPLRVLIWHEIVNDEVAGTPVAVTYCPLCNAAVVFDRTVRGRVLEFGTTGKLRHSDLVMYDRQTASWWQQYTGAGIVGQYTGTRLQVRTSRLESYAAFAARHPDGEVLVPGDPRLRPYGVNPYVGYDSASAPFLYDGEVPEGIEPLARVVVVGGQAWSLDLLRRNGMLEHGDLVFTWEPGQNSALDHRRIAAGRDVGTVTVQSRRDGTLEDVPYSVTFAFVFHAFEPDGQLHTR